MNTPSHRLSPASDIHHKMMAANKFFLAVLALMACMGGTVARSSLGDLEHSGRTLAQSRSLSVIHYLNEWLAHYHSKHHLQKLLPCTTLLTLAAGRNMLSY